MSEENNSVLPDSNLPVVTQEAIDIIFQILEGMEVELDENPLDYGPRRLNNKVAQARRFRNDTESLYLKVSHWLQRYKAAHRAAEVALELGKKHLMTNDIEVRAGRNISDRDAIASIKMRADVEEVSRIASVISDLTTVLAVVKAKRADLNDVQGRIRDQMKLCQEEIGLGAQWGSKPPPGSNAPDLDDTPDVNKVTLKDLTDLFQGVRVDGKTMADLLREDTEEEEPEPEQNMFGEGGVVNEGAQKDFEEMLDKKVMDTVEQVAKPEESEEPARLEDIPLEMFPQTGFCAGFDELCGMPQHMTPSGPSCANGHGGADTLTEEELEEARKAEASADPFAEAVEEAKRNPDTPVKGKFDDLFEEKTEDVSEAGQAGERKSAQVELEPEPPKEEGAETISALLDGSTEDDNEADKFLNDLEEEKPEPAPARRKSKLDLDSILSDFGL